ncbi:T9SS type A sorting domain-containing protein [Kaistella sp. G5-32]|uniref:T9SS type A sorting domain-containing protein n=1 Tax=Kaistella gelatinilytica TaxID=2787636 RepID=A0ABS0FEC7_9FLAO|nr:T9SS type A sorting domain-containing protein [Kaistella gelatinilytica]MBF8458054.1 T9SS type A sorting domain-containing protein [Kaistella gelatinilytica]
MKTIITKIQVLSLIFLFQTIMIAQTFEEYAFRGGNSDGFATEKVENLSCGTPFNQFAYFGGNADGAAVETIADNASCGTPFNQFAYFGGINDGAAVETLMSLSCATPYHFFAYFGGTGDGFSVGKTADTCPILAPVADFTADQTTTCVGRPVKFTDTSTNKPTGWTWTFQGGTPATASTKTVDVTYNAPGTYQVKLVAANYIGNDTKIKMGYITVLADCTTLTTTALTKTKMQIYPNPTKSMLYLKSPQNVLNIEIYDGTGRKVMETKPNQKDPSINLETLSAGMYMMKTRTTEGEEVYKIIKKD